MKKRFRSRLSTAEKYIAFRSIGVKMRTVDLIGIIFVCSVLF